MGLFSSKKKIYVSSTVYNLAGDDKDRVNYLKTTVAGKIIADTNPSVSLSEAITNSYLNGPGLKLRSFGKWANTSGYNTLIGLQSGTLFLGDSIDDVALVPYLPVPPGSTAVLQSADIDFADYTWWADQYILDNHPELLDTDYASDYNETSGIITIHYADGSTESFTPSGYNIGATYLYASYFVSSGSVVGPVVPGVPVVLGPTDPFLSLDGWTTDSANSKNTDYSLKTTTDELITYSDGRPDESTHAESSSTETAPVIDNQYHKSEYKGASSSGSSQESLTVNSMRYDYQTNTVVDGAPVVTTKTETLPDGVTVKTTTTTVVAQELQKNRGYRIDTQDVTNSLSSNKIYIYQYQTGIPALDVMFAPDASVGQFLPFIPVRVDNDMITDKRFAAYYPMVEKAYKKATRAEFTELLDKVKENKDLDDIDYAYVVFGVSLNVKDNSCRKYVYTFFDQLLDSVGNNPAYAQYRAQMAAAQQSNIDFQNWTAAQSDPSNPLYGTPRPKVLSYPSLPTQKLQVKSNSRMNFNMTIQWSNIAKTTGTGLREPGRKAGDCWFAVGADDDYDQIIFNGSTTANNSFSVNHFIIYRQVTDNRWEALHVYGLKHVNKIYGGKSVTTDAKDAYKDTEESGFIIPVQRDIFSAASIKDSTQMSTACNFMVFNTYQVVKSRWYQSGWFKVVLVVIVIIVSVYTGGAGAGLLGSSLAVGTAVGLTGVAAIIAGTLANALAAMLLTKLLGLAATQIFGDKLGAIIGAVAAVIAVAVGTSMVNGGSISTGFASLTRADNIIKLTEAAGNGYAEYMQAAVNETVAETQAVLDQYQDKMKDINAKYSDLFGTDPTGMIDPLKLTEATTHFIESGNSFIDRTMMTGEDIANLSLGLITNFTDVTLSSELPI